MNIRKCGMQVLFSSLALALAGTAHAGNLVNKDAKSYDIEVKKSGGTMKTSIASNTTKQGLCSDSCKIVVKGVGEIGLEKGQNAEIRNGKITRK
jgi:hypothetical protein